MSFFLNRIYFSPLLAVTLIFVGGEAAYGRSYKDFDKASAQIGSKKLDAVFLALTETDRALGLMNVTVLPKNHGVLFVFAGEAPRSFWMKNTFIPLSIGHFSEHGCLLEIIDMKPVKSAMQRAVPTYPSSVNARYSLEVNKGWFQKNGIKVGDGLRVSGLSPQLKKTLSALEKSSECTAAKASRAN